MYLAETRSTRSQDEFGLFPNRCAAAPLREILVEVCYGG